LEYEIEMLVKMTQDLIRQNAHVAQNQEEYKKRYESMIEIRSQENVYDD